MRRTTGTSPWSTRCSVKICPPSWSTSERVHCHFHPSSKRACLGTNHFGAISPHWCKVEFVPSGNKELEMWLEHSPDVFGWGGFTVFFVYDDIFTWPDLVFWVVRNADHNHSVLCSSCCAWRVIAMYLYCSRMGHGDILQISDPQYSSLGFQYAHPVFRRCHVGIKCDPYVSMHTSDVAHLIVASRYFIPCLMPIRMMRSIRHFGTTIFSCF